MLRSNTARRKYNSNNSADSVHSLASLFLPSSSLRKQQRLLETDWQNEMVSVNWKWQDTPLCHSCLTYTDWAQIPQWHSFRKNALLLLSICISDTSQLELCTINPHLHCICLFLKKSCMFRAQINEKPELLLTDDPDKDKYDDTANSDTIRSFK